MNPNTQTITAGLEADQALVQDILAEIERGEAHAAGDKSIADGYVTGEETLVHDTMPAMGAGDDSLDAMVNAGAETMGLTAPPAVVVDKLPAKKGKKPTKPAKQAKQSKKTAKPAEEPVMTGDVEAAGDSDDAAPDAPAETGDAPQVDAKPKIEKKPRVTFVGNRKSKVLADRMGGRMDELLIFERADALLPPEELAEKQSEFLRELDTTVAKKVAEKCIMLLKDLTAGRRVSNQVMMIAFHLLKKDGKLTVGSKGNLYAALSEHYTHGTNLSQANQVFTLFPLLKITKPKVAGELVANPESNFLALVNGPMSESDE